MTRSTTPWRSIRSVVLLVILAPSSRIFVPKFLVPTMPPLRSRPRSTFSRHQLVDTILKTGSLAMRPCSNCERAGYADKCKVGASSQRCVECARKGSSDCNLAPFSPAKWTRIWKERNKKAQEAKEALAKFIRLQREVEELERRGIAIVEGEVQNIEDNEASEAKEQAFISPDDFLFNVSSEQVEVPLDFDFNGLVDVGGTTVEASGSSQGS